MSTWCVTSISNPTLPTFYLYIHLAVLAPWHSRQQQFSFFLSFSFQHSLRIVVIFKSPSKRVLGVGRERCLVQIPEERLWCLFFGWMERQFWCVVHRTPHACLEPSPKVYVVLVRYLRTQEQDYVVLACSISRTLQRLLASDESCVALWFGRLITSYTTNPLFSIF